MNLDILHKEYELTDEFIRFYEENRFVKLKKVLPPPVIEYFNFRITDKVNELKSIDIPIEERNTYGKAFLQLFNLWKEDEMIRQLVFSKRLAQIACDLMQVSGVRLYHDQALFKEAGGGITPWHADQHYWPLLSDKTITAWIPLQETPLKMGPLEFSAQSHTILSGRELSISDESEARIQEQLKINDFEHIIEPFDVGEVSFHSGWIFHRAGENRSSSVRKVMTIIYMDKNMRLGKPENKGQLNDWQTWCPTAKIGEIINTALNPVLFERYVSPAVVWRTIAFALNNLKCGMMVNRILTFFLSGVFHCALINVSRSVLQKPITFVNKNEKEKRHPAGCLLL